jgi:hypothetical protein
MIAQEGSYYIDFKNVYSSSMTHGDFSSHEIFRSVAQVATRFMSAFEHTVLEQTMGSDKPGVSTIKLMQIANATGRKVFRTTSSNFSAIKPQLINYSTTDLNSFQEHG